MKQHHCGLWGSRLNLLITAPHAALRSATRSLQHGLLLWAQTELLATVGLISLLFPFRYGALSPHAVGGPRGAVCLLVLQTGPAQLSVGKGICPNFVSAALKRIPKINNGHLPAFQSGLSGENKEAGRAERDMCKTYKPALEQQRKKSCFRASLLFFLWPLQLGIQL